VIEVLSGEGILSKQEAPSVRPGHGMDRNNLRGIKIFARANLMMIHSVERTEPRIIDSE
jgi:hypothetical protein